MRNINVSFISYGKILKHIHIGKYVVVVNHYFFTIQAVSFFLRLVIALKLMNNTTCSQPNFLERTHREHGVALTLTRFLRRLGFYLKIIDIDL
jgi:hypothetical protein